MSLSIETVLTLLEAYPYLLLFTLVLLEGPIYTSEIVAPSGRNPDQHRAVGHRRGPPAAAV